MTSNSNKTESGEYSGGVILQGYHKKLKTMKKKYFVLYEECGKSEARLEYFDNEKKFKSKASPKQTIILNSCFNINRSLDTKHDFVITLSTKDRGFGIVMDSEEDMNKWLKAMLKLQKGHNIYAGPPKPYYEHVWQVVVQKKGLAEKKGIFGNYHVCLSSKSVTFIRIGLERTGTGETRVPVIEFYLTSIRRCGDSKCYFYMEVGRHSVVGAGELWMETKDPLTAQNMHTMILNVSSSSADDPYGPMRKRSSSATETSKPVSILQRRQTHSGSKTLNSSPSSAVNRDRCDSLPSSRNRTITESVYNSIANTSMPPSRTMSSLSTVPNSTYNRHSHSPPVNSNVLSPSMGFSESDGSTFSIDEPDSMKHSLTPDEGSGFVSRLYNSRSPGGVIPEENSDEFWYAENKTQNCTESASLLDKFNIHTEDGVKTLSSSSNIHSEEESQYMDMFNSISPCETALCDTNLGGAESHFKNCNDSSDGNSRASSLAEEIVDGYVHMSSPQTSDYVDMEQSLKSRRQIMNLGLSSARNITSGRPLRDMCFVEYPLSTEKVNAGAFRDEDEIQLLNERPPRAYSVGSRMEHNNQKLRIEVIANSDQNNCRVRAFSVGSRAKVPRCELQRNILMSANSSSSKHSNVNSNSKSSIGSLEPTSESAVRGRKSSSAPLLIHKSQNSVDRMDDLMEIDFSKNSGSRSNSLSSQSAGASSYLFNLPKGNHMRSSTLSSSPGQYSLHKKSHDSFSEQTTDNGYLEMRPVICSNRSANNDDSLDHLSTSNGSSISDLPESRPQDIMHNKLKMEDWNKIETPEGYLEMSWNGNRDNSQPIIEQFNTNNKSLVHEICNAKPRSAPIDLKKSRGISKLSMLQSQSAQLSQKSAMNSIAKSESSQRKRFNNSFTISEEERPTGNDLDEAMSDKMKDLNIKAVSEKIDSDLSKLNVNEDYVNFSVGVSMQLSPPTKCELDTVETEKPKDVDCQLNTSNKQNANYHSKEESNKASKHDSLFEDKSKFARKSSSPKCTPTSPHSSSARCDRFGNSGRQVKGSGYELLHICSDSSLQTRKNTSRPNSVNSDRVFPLEGTQSRPNSVNSDCLQMNSVSSSAATLCSSSFLSPKNCDKSQDSFQSDISNPHNDDNKLRNADSSTLLGLIDDDMNSPKSKIASTCQPPCEKKLNYASLDLRQSSTKNPNTTIFGARSSISDDTSTSLSPNSNISQQSASTYAEIAFTQCETKKLKCGTQNNP